jgi:hypothetical protein
MNIKTYGELKDRVAQDLDIEDEEFVQTAELRGVANDALREAQQEINDLQEDYYKTSTAWTFVNGQAEYEYPADIYELKIREITYVNGEKRYPIKRYRDPDKAMKRREAEAENISEARYRWDHQNSAADGPQMVLVPPAYESGALAQIDYIRDVVEIEDDDSVMDCPSSAVTYIRERMKGHIRGKENGNTIPQDAVQAIDRAFQAMRKTLAERVPDNDTTIEPDLSHYAEHT